MHWSTPFLGSVPARTAAARNLTAWARVAGSRLTVTGVSSGFQVAAASGRRQLAGDLAGVVDLLADHRSRRTGLLAASASDPVIEGPATPPPARHALDPAGTRPPTDPPAAAVGAMVLPPDPRRRYRVPALLAWLALADGMGVLGSAALEINLGGGQGVELKVHDGVVVCCEVRNVTGSDRVVAIPDARSAQLLDLLR